MTSLFQPSGLQASALLGDSDSPTKSINLGWPGLEPGSPCLDILIFDDSWSLAAPDGSDPVGNRYREADQVIQKVAKWTRTTRQQVAVLRFDYPEVPLFGPQPINTVQAVAAVREALPPPPGVTGSSRLAPAMMAASNLARQTNVPTVRCTIFSDFALMDQNRDQPYDEMRRFPGSIHAVVMNATPPDALTALPNVLITPVTSEDPPGLLAAAVAHSLTATRPGARPAQPHRPPRFSGLL